MPGHAKAGQWKEAQQAVDRAVELATRFKAPNRAAFVEHAKRVREASRY